MTLAFVSDQHDNPTPPFLNRGDLCRFAAHPFDDCHCLAITSAKVPLALYFCGGHYQECCIYQVHVDQAEE